MRACVRMCVRACVRACVRVRVCVCVCVCVWWCGLMPFVVLIHQFISRKMIKHSLLSGVHDKHSSLSESNTRFCQAIRENALVSRAILTPKSFWQPKTHVCYAIKHCSLSGNQTLQSIRQSNKQSKTLLESAVQLKSFRRANPRVLQTNQHSSANQTLATFPLTHSLPPGRHMTSLTNCCPVYL